MVWVVEDSNRHLAAIVDYVGQREWDLEDRKVRRRTRRARKSVLGMRRWPAGQAVAKNKK